MSMADTIEAAYRRLNKELGRLPTSQEVVQATGAGGPYVRDVMRKRRLEWKKGGCLGDPSAAQEALHKRTAERHAVFVQAHETLMRCHGRLPTLKELAVKTGLSRDGAYAACRRLGLPYGDTRRRDYRMEKTAGSRTETTTQAEKPAPEAPDKHERATANMAKIISIRMDGDPQKRPEVFERAGMRSSAQERQFICCPVCGVRRLIAPRMHPFWLRNRAGEVIFVCKAACMGRVV